MQSRRALYYPLTRACTLFALLSLISHTTSLVVQKILLLLRETMRTTLHKKPLQVQIAD